MSKKTGSTSEKREFLKAQRLSERKFEQITPDKDNNWINLTDNDFNTLIPIASKKTKATKNPFQENAIFKLFSLGVVTARDEWVYDDNSKKLEKKVRHLIKAYNADLIKLNGFRESKDLVDMLDYSIKWTRAVKNDLRKGISYKFDKMHFLS